MRLDDEPTPFMSVAAFAAAHKWPSERSVRHWLYQNTDGFRSRCARRIGRSVVLNVAAVWAWVDEHVESAAEVDS
ncbi:MAG: hypothetical protein EP329_14935 [Deltaproteobacteria bacterium]|nr:MAG: hypothetical protein EP329_14935 [Deltaproteobacteria bacterium]